MVALNFHTCTSITIAIVSTSARTMPNCVRCWENFASSHAYATQLLTLTWDDKEREEDFSARLV
eukprot:600889-Amphidinium_carterae.1